MIKIGLRSYDLIKKVTLSSLGLALVFSLTGCEKVANSAKNIQSDWVGLERNVELYSCMTGKLIKVYRGDVRMNPEDTQDTSLLINGKRIHTNLCYVIAEIGTKEEPLTSK